MTILKLKTTWITPDGKLKPGEYKIPEQVSLRHAKCAVLDLAGEIIREKKVKPVAEKPKAEPPKRRGRPPRRASNASAPENKVGLGGDAGSDSSDRPEPDSAPGGDGSGQSVDI